MGVVLLLRYCYMAVAVIASLSRLIICHTSLERLMPISQLLIQSANSPIPHAIGMVEGRDVSSLMDAAPGWLWLASPVSGLVMPCKGHLWSACAPRVFTHWHTGWAAFTVCRQFLKPIDKCQDECHAPQSCKHSLRMALCPHAIRANNVTAVCSSAIPLKGQNQ